MADTTVSKLPLPAQLGISIGLGAVLLGVFYFMVYDGMLTEEKSKTKQLNDLKQQIQQLEVTAAKLSEFQREVAVLEQKLEQLKRILPPEKETPDLIRKLQNLAAESNLRIRQFNPQPVRTQEFYQEYPINLEVDGNYHNLALFFDRVGRLSRLVNAGNIKVTAKKDQTPLSTITAQCVATTYVYLEGAAAAAAAPAAPGPGRPGAARRPAGRAR
jgi:type IV pilus assembly protein PilO